jgi:hypothetical protein
VGDDTRVEADEATYLVLGCNAGDSGVNAPPCRRIQPWNDVSFISPLTILLVTHLM